MAINSILQVTPALLGYTIFGLILWFFVSQQDRRGIIISSFFFLISGFLFQSVFENLNVLKHFATEYKDIFSIPIFTILATALGIFSGNRILRYTDKRKEQEEISVIFVNTIDSQVNCMSLISFYLFGLYEGYPNPNKYFKMYLSELSNNKVFETAFTRIGIYSEIEIDCISYYFTKQQALISMMNKILLDCEIFMGTESLSQEYLIEFKTVNAFVVTTIFLGLLCLIQMSRFYSLERMKGYQKDFEDLFIELLEELNQSLPVIKRDLCQGFVERLEWLKKHYPKSYTMLIKVEKDLYICIIQLNEDIIHNIFRFQITGNTFLFGFNNIISFGKSEEEAKKNGKKNLKELIQEQLKIYPPDLKEGEIEDIQRQIKNLEKYNSQLNTKIDNLFNQLNTEVKNITPWK